MDEAERHSSEYKEFWANLNRGQYQAEEFKRIGKGGKEVWLQASYNPILDLNGKPFKVVKYASDITPQKAAADDLKRKVDSILVVVSAASKGDLTQEVTVSGTDAMRPDGDGVVATLREPAREHWKDRSNGGDAIHIVRRTYVHEPTDERHR